jgi:type I restriction enzyme S subunit
MTNKRNDVLIMNTELPKDWKLEKIKSVAELFRGITYSKEVASDKPDNSRLPILRANNINVELNYDNLVYVPKEIIKKEQFIKKNDIIFAMSSGSKHLVGKSAVAKKNFNGSYGAFCALLRANESVNKKYISYIFQGNAYRKLISEIAKGTNINNLKREHILDFEFPLPPLSEQQTIVAKLEEFLSELEKGKEQLHTALDQLKVYRQAVLRYAFEGKLTNKNVKEGELPEGWKWVKVLDISNVVRGGSPRPAGDLKYYGGKIPFLKVADLTRDGSIFLHSFEYTIKEAGLRKTRQIKPETLLLTNSGATLGVPKICMIDATMNDGIAAFLDLDKRSNLYMYYYWTGKTQQLRNVNQGAAQPNLNTDIIKNCEVPYCSFEEQERVVQEIESHLSVADKLEETITASLQQSETLRQSILKKAFEGKLV